MKNIFSYIKKYGDFTFYEKGFNDIDNLVFSALTYVGFDSKSFTIYDGANRYFSTHSKSQILDNILAVRQGIKVLEKIMNTKRYKDLLVYNYVYIGDLDKQFSAMCIKVKEDLIYVGFEGTDQLISGWKEDFQMSYMFPIPSQKMAIDYLNDSIKFSDKKIIVGGHSKGGNLALVASMYAKFWVQRKIVKIYNNDGPGLRKKQIDSLRYKLVSKKLVHIIPNYSLVGLLLRQGSAYKVIYSYENGFLAHDMCTWKIEDDQLVETNLSFISKMLDDGIIKWLDCYDDQQRKMFVESLFDVCDRAGIDNLLDIKDDTLNNLFKIIKETQNIDQGTKDMLLDLFKFLMKYFISTIKLKMFK